MVGRLSRVHLREVWKHEAVDFSQWLANNLDLLSETIGIQLVSVETEHPTGSFIVDLLAEDNAGNPVVIENQLEKSDHDHLGKLLTYMVSLESKTAVWIVSDPRPEHVGVISWLNESSSANFFLVKIEAIKIDNSKPAPLFTLVIGPSDESRSVSRTKQDLAERHMIRYRFWEELLEEAKSKTTLHSNISPTYDNWISTSAGKPGLYFNYSIRQHQWQVDLGIDLGKDQDKETKGLFQTFFDFKNDIEHEFGDSLEWDIVEGRRSCRIKKVGTTGGYRDNEKWFEIHNEMVDTMIRLASVMFAHIDRL